MRQEKRRLLIREVLGDLVLDPVAQKQVARQSKHATELLLVRDGCKDRDGAALREPAQHDPRRLDALVDLLLDQDVEVVARAEDARFVLRADRLFKVQLVRELTF